MNIQSRLRHSGGMFCDSFCRQVTSKYLQTEAILIHVSQSQAKTCACCLWGPLRINDCSFHSQLLGQFVPVSYQRKLPCEYKWEDFLSSLQSDPIENLEFCLNCRKSLYKSIVLKEPHFLLEMKAIPLLA